MSPRRPSRPPSRARPPAGRHSLDRIWPPVAFGVAALLLWELVVTVSGVPAFLLPAPSAIAAQVVAAFPTILSTAAVTGGNALVGLVVGFVLGVGLALLAARSRIVSELATPLVSAAAAVPIVALAPVFTTMFGSTTELPRRLVVRSWSSCRCSSRRPAGSPR